MGIDYTGHYGIGVQVNILDFDDEDLIENFDGINEMSEYLEEKLDTDKYRHFEVGWGNYNGHDNEFYVDILDPFVNGLDTLSEQKDDLLKHLEEICITPIGEFGLIGGLEVD